MECTLIHQSLAKLAYPTNLIRTKFAPKIAKPAMPGIPRFNFWWWRANDANDVLICKVEAEVDADKRELKSLYFEHTAYWDKPPPIKLPLTLPAQTPRSNQAPPAQQQKPPPRPFIPYDSKAKR